MRARWSPQLTVCLLACCCAVVTTLPALAKGGWDPTVLTRVDSTSMLGAYARVLDHSFKTVHPGAYDGQFYWGIAIDPLAQGHLHTAFDKASYRYGHPLYGWIGWLLSAGRARPAALALEAIDVASFGIAAALAMGIGRRRGGRGWEALFVALNAGLLTAVSHDLAEPLAAAILLGAITAYLAQRRVLLWALLAALPLTKEPLVLVVVAFAISEATLRRPRNAAILAAAALPTFGWWIYLRLHLGAWFTTGDSALAAPFTGWWTALVGAPTSHGALPAAATVALALLLLMFAVTAAYAFHHRDPIALAYLGLATVVACLAPNATVSFTTALRNTALLTLIVPFAIFSPQRLSIAKQHREAPTQTE